MMLIALSGTPGVGKTNASEMLRIRGYSVLSLDQLAEENDFVVGYDENMDAKIIDVDALDDFVRKNFAKKNIIIEGHLSHMLSVDIVIILRCDPLVLEERLKDKGWPEKKIRENMGAEILDVIKVEALELRDEVYEIETTRRSAEEVADAIEGIINGNYEKPYIDWLDEYEYLLFD